MISLRCQVCAIADRIVSAIHSSALYAGIKMETNGFKAIGSSVDSFGRATPFQARLCRSPSGFIPGRERVRLTFLSYNQP